MKTIKRSQAGILILSTLFIIGLLTGCGNAKRDPFDGDPAVPKFKVNPADYCKADGIGGATGPLSVDRGPEGDHFFGQGGGCVARPIAQAWGVTFNLEAMKWGGVTEFSFKMGTPPPHVSHFLEIYYVVKDVVTVKWAMQWYHSVGIGEKSNPKLIWINYKRVSGTTYIPYWEGTMALQEIAPGITGFAMRNQISAANTGASEAGGSVEDVYNALVNATPSQIP